MASHSATLTIPRPLRPDLTFVRHGVPGNSSLVVKQPGSGKFFRLGEVEAFIAEQFDGATTFDEIRRRTETKFDAPLTTSALATFAASLSKAGFLDDGVTRQKPTGPRPRIYGSLLRVQLRVLDPNHLLGGMLRGLGWAFTKDFVFVGTLLICAAATIVGASWSEITPELHGLFRINTIPVVVATIFCVISAHEFGHGLTCRRFGGEVHEMGAMLMYFQPALYCDVSEAWLVEDRWQRICVSVAGPFVELIIWSLATVAWRLTEPATPIHDVGLIVMAASGAHTLLNFNPFLKLDGYYILSDLLEIPNLRRRSFAYVGAVLKHWSGLGPRPASPAPRERWIYAIYGSVASAGTFAVLGYILFTAGGYLVDGKQPLVMALTTLAVVLRVQRRFQRLFKQKTSAADPDDDDADDSAAATTVAEAPPAEPVHATAALALAVNDAAAAAPPAEPPAPPKPSAPAAADERETRRAREKRSRRQRRALWGALAAAVLLFVAFGRAQLSVAGSFTVRPERNADMRAEVDGIVAEVLIKEGQRVNAGDVIVRLSSRDQRAQLETVDADLARANAQLRLLQAGTLPDSIALARATLTRMQDALKYAQLKSDRVRELADRGFATVDERESAQAVADDARNAAKEAENRLKVFEAGSRPEEVSAARANIDHLAAQRRLLDTQLHMVEVRSLASGVVATPERQLHDLRGQLVTKGTLLAKVFEMHTVTVEMVVSEKEIGEVEVGAPVLVRARAWPERTFSGQVVAIAAAMQGATAPLPAESVPTAPVSATPPASTILVTTEIENPELLLKPGMSGEAKILCGRRPIRELLHRRLLRTLNLQVWSWW